MVQEYVEAAPALDDFSAAGPPVLRITTARVPGRAPFLHSAFLTICVPGENPRNFLSGQLRAVVDAKGVLQSGISFARPQARLQYIPWNGAVLAGRPLPHFEEAIHDVLAAMALLPGVALVNWDTILTAQGPVILEGPEFLPMLLRVFKSVFTADLG